MPLSSQSQEDSYSWTTKLGITFASGLLAGVICAIVSYPADPVVSLMEKAETRDKMLTQIASKTGFRTLAKKGIGARILLIGTWYFGPSK